MNCCAVRRRLVFLACFSFDVFGAGPLFSTQGKLWIISWGRASGTGRREERGSPYSALSQRTFTGLYFFFLTFGTDLQAGFTCTYVQKSKKVFFSPNRDFRFCLVHLIFLLWVDQMHLKMLSQMLISPKIETFDRAVIWIFFLDIYTYHALLLNEIQILQKRC